MTLYNLNDYKEKISAQHTFPIENEDTKLFKLPDYKYGIYSIYAIDTYVNEEEFSKYDNLLPVDKSLYAQINKFITDVKNNKFNILNKTDFIFVPNFKGQENIICYVLENGTSSKILVQTKYYDYFNYRYNNVTLVSVNNSTVVVKDKDNNGFYGAFATYYANLSKY